MKLLKISATLVLTIFLVSCSSSNSAQDKRPFCEKKYGSLAEIDWALKDGIKGESIKHTFSGFRCLYTQTEKLPQDSADQCKFDSTKNNYNCRSQIYNLKLLCKNQELDRYWDPSMFRDVCK
jgi:hypothetical protein